MLICCVTETLCDIFFRLTSFFFFATTSSPFITIIKVIINCLFEFNILGSVLAAFTKDGGGWPKDGKHWQLRWKLPKVGRNYLNRESLSTRQWMKQGHWKIQETSTETFWQKARFKLFFIKLITSFFCCCLTLWLVWYVFILCLYI